MCKPQEISTGELLGDLVPSMVLALAILIGGWSFVNFATGVPIEVSSGGGALGLGGRVNLAPFTMMAVLFVLVSGFAAAESGGARYLSGVPFFASIWLLPGARERANDPSATILHLVVLLAFFFATDFVLAARVRRSRRLAQRGRSASAHA